MSPHRPFGQVRLPALPTAMAPDGSEVRALADLPAGSMAHFRLPAGAVSSAVRHRTVDEIWYVLSGDGEIFRRGDSETSITRLESGMCITIPVGTAFQFRAGAHGPVDVLAVTMPPWPGDDEAERVAGHPDW